MKKAVSINLGEMVGIDDTALTLPDTLPGNSEIHEDFGSDAGDALWWFMNKGTINGVPVADVDRSAKVDSDKLLQEAFILERVPHSEMFKMSPDNADELARYDELLKKVYEGKALIVDETKQFCPDKGYFLVWMRYDELRYVLHPRYAYLKE